MDHYKQEVKDRLKAPATASFPREPGMLAGYDPDKNVTTLAAVGDVDSQNSFGAMLRSGYMIFWEQPGDGADFNPVHPPSVYVWTRQ